jgi:hypothetical protein
MPGFFSEGIDAPANKLCPIDTAGDRTVWCGVGLNVLELCLLFCSGLCTRLWTTSMLCVVDCCGLLCVVCCVCVGWNVLELSVVCGCDL